MIDSVTSAPGWRCNMRKGFIALLVLVILTWAARPAAACINDHETQRQEQQFKSLYPDTSSPSLSDPDTATSPLVAYGGSGVGIALLAAAGYVGLVRR